MFVLLDKNNRGLTNTGYEALINCKIHFESSLINSLPRYKKNAKNIYWDNKVTIVNVIIIFIF